MKLPTCARQAGVHPRTAYRWFHAGRLPVAARQVETGTILVEPPSPSSMCARLYGLGSALGRAQRAVEAAGEVAA